MTQTIKPVDVDREGNYTFNLSADGANQDWIRAERIQKKAEDGDADAKEELETLRSETVFERAGIPPAPMDDDVEDTDAYDGLDPEDMFDD